MTDIATKQTGSNAKLDVAHLSENKRKVLEALLQGQLATPGAKRSVLTPRPPDEPVPLSFPQLQVWLHTEWAPEIPFYNESLTVFRHGSLDVPILKRCMLEILRRHEIWRTTFELRNGEPVQVIRPAPSSFPLPLADLRNLPEAERETEARRLATEDARLPFDLKEGPLFRARLVRMGDEEYRLYMAFHHIIFDGVTGYRAFLPELATLYEAFCADKPSPLPEPPLQYADFACWQRKRLSPEVWSEHMAFWRKRLSGELPVLEWPTDRPRPAMETHRGECAWIAFPKNLVHPLRALAQKQGISLYVTLLASFAALLHRYTGLDDIIIGAMSSGRKLPELESLMGFFVNPLPLRIDLSGDPTFLQLVSRVEECVLDGLAHEDVPFVQMLKEIQYNPDASRHPIYQVIFSQQPPMPGSRPGWDLAPGQIPNGGSKLDLHIILDERDDEVFGPLTYNSDLLDPSTIARMVGHWQTLLGAVVADPGKRISELPLLTDSERKQILVEWNDTRVDYPKDACLHELIEAQVEKTLEATAVVFEQQRLSYRELNTRANQLAHHLRRLGVGIDKLVGVCMERSVEMAVALLGALKAGGAYVPLDPEYPKDRLLMMLEDSLPLVLLTQQHLLERLPVVAAQVIPLDTDWHRIADESGLNPARLTSPESLSYVIYTSGSTGRPKGVLNTHAGIVNRLLWMQDAYRLTPSDRVLQKTPYSFDVSVWEFFWPLMTGACLVVAKPGGHKDADYLVDLICREQITTLHFVPSMLQAFLEVEGTERCVCLKRVICSGEALPFKVQERFFARSRADLHNLYGPTEAAVDVTYWQCQPEGKDTLVPIGRPIANVRIHLLDRNLQPVPAGVSAELHIGGVALARGYLNRPELTAQKFIRDPFASEPGARLYKTGDLARYRSDGVIEYLGRIDDQVKMRGFRIELGEIESVLCEYPSVHDARVIVREDIPGNRHLVAYVVLVDEGAPSLVGIRDFLKGKLPPYMIPEMVQLDRLPLTPNGKLDRRALPAPNQERSQDKEAFGEPQGDVEKLLAKIWTDILKVKRVSIYDNFFDLGGHSLLAIQVVARLQNQLGVRIRPNELAFHTLGQLAALCGERHQVR